MDHTRRLDEAAKQIRIVRNELANRDVKLDRFVEAIDETLESLDEDRDRLDELTRVFGGLDGD